jgi:hypothetical protein
MLCGGLKLFIQTEELLTSVRREIFGLSVKRSSFLFQSEHEYLNRTEVITLNKWVRN